MTEPSRPHGTGPGAITPDGCAVDFYARMTAMGEPEIVHEAAGPGASILELGCGTGRITHPLAELGHEVVAVDESPEMLAHVHGAQTVCARIEDLALGRVLADAGLRLDRYLTDDHGWFRAVPAGD
jgi:SAM-dependent methyltransferase